MSYEKPIGGVNLKAGYEVEEDFGPPVSVYVDAPIDPKAAKEEGVRILLNRAYDLLKDVMGEMKKKGYKPEQRDKVDMDGIYEPRSDDDIMALCIDPKGVDPNKYPNDVKEAINTVANKYKLGLGTGSRKKA